MTMTMTRDVGGAVERAFYFWTGLILTSFFGFFAVWTAVRIGIREASGDSQRG